MYDDLVHIGKLSVDRSKPSILHLGLLHGTQPNLAQSTAVKRHWHYYSGLLRYRLNHAART